MKSEGHSFEGIDSVNLKPGGLLLKRTGADV
jgi:hypothetical protein